MPLGIGALIRWLGPIFLRFFALNFAFKWVKFVAVLYAKIAVFWAIWMLFKNYIMDIFGLVAVYVNDYFPSPSDPVVQNLLKAAKVTAVWFPWEYLGACILVILTFKLWLLSIKLVMKIFGAVSWAINWIWQGNTA